MFLSHICVLCLASLNWLTEQVVWEWESGCPIDKSKPKQKCRKLTPDSNMKYFFWTQRKHSEFQSNPKPDTALQSINLCQSYLVYKGPVKVWMLLGFSSICLREICWKKWETNTNNTTYYEWLRKAGILAFSRNGLSPYAAQLVIYVINSIMSQTFRGRAADMTVLWYQYCMDLAGTTN